MLKNSNFSRKKLELIALQRDEELRSIFAADVAMYSQQSLDETGSDRRDAVRYYGYGLRGKPEIASKRTHFYNSCNDMLDVKIVRGGEDFIDFIITSTFKFFQWY